MENFLFSNIPYMGDILNLSSGKNIRVMIIDDGSFSHKDINENVETDLTKDLCPQVGNQNSIFHGTQMAGLICGKNTGVAKDSRIIPVRIFDQSSKFGVNQNLYYALKYALEVRPDIINISMKTPGNFRIYKEIIDKLFYQENILLVWAFGKYTSCSVPCSFYNKEPIISVSNSEFFDEKFPPDLIILQNKIRTTTGNNLYTHIRGTSGFAAIISGILAIILSFLKEKGQKIKAIELKNLLSISCIESKPKFKVLCLKLLHKNLLEFSNNYRNLL